MSETPGLDPHTLVEALEVFLLGDEPTLTSEDFSERSGIAPELSKERWRSLGFTSVPDGERAFTEYDLMAMELTDSLMARGLIEPGAESAHVRTVGRAFARLAEWQINLITSALDLESMDLEEMAVVVEEIVPIAEQLQSYVWRRHILAAASRAIFAASSGADAVMAVGFADIVDYTRRSRSLTQEEIGRLVDVFEAKSQEAVTEHHGQVIKTIGDEVLFTAPSALACAEIALTLVEAHLLDENFPELRVGCAYGEVLSRLGDVFGPTVNVAARLTSHARAGKIAVDRNFADQLIAEPEFRLRKMRRTSVKGYRRLEPWSLRRPVPVVLTAAGEETSAASRMLAEAKHDLLEVVDKMQVIPKRAPAGETTE